MNKSGEEKPEQGTGEITASQVIDQYGIRIQETLSVQDGVKAVFLDGNTGKIKLRPVAGLALVEHFAVRDGTVLNNAKDQKVLPLVSVNGSDIVIPFSWMFPDYVGIKWPYENLDDFKRMAKLKLQAVQSAASGSLEGSSKETLEGRTPDEVFLDGLDEEEQG